MLNFIKENLFLFIIVFLLIVAPSFLFGMASIIAYIMLGLFLLAVIGTLVIKWKVRKFVKESGFDPSQFGAKGEFRGDGRGRGRDGANPDVKVYRTTNPAEDKRVASDVGDYVDFEEIKEKR